MTELITVEAPSTAQASVDVTDRRRPGRAENVNPMLIPILRGAETELEIEFDEVDQAAAIRGLAFGALLSAPIWALIAYVGTRFLS